MDTSKTDVLTQLGVRTKRGKNLSNPKATGGPKTTSRDQKGFGVEKPVKTPTKNNGVGKIISYFGQG